MRAKDIARRFEILFQLFADGELRVPAIATSDIVKEVVLDIKRIADALEVIAERPSSAPIDVAKEVDEALSRTDRMEREAQRFKPHAFRQSYGPSYVKGYDGNDDIPF